ncbi:hypothetical protein AXI57_08750 [Bacillus atrophaeus]|nr:hypothetical protein AXI57_08750 [Bacillus atrophaeus]
MAANTVNPGLMVLATGAGSVIACDVNDAGFWMVKEFFGLTVKETFQTWTLLSTILSVTGLGCVLLLARVSLISVAGPGCFEPLASKLTIINEKNDLSRFAQSFFLLYEYL